MTSSRANEGIATPPHPSPVLALTVVDGATLSSAGSITADTKIMMAVRSAETNQTHPNVISVPTQRIPKFLFEEISSDVRGRTRLTGQTDLLDAQVHAYPAQRSHDAVLYAVNSLLSRKIGLSDALELNTIKYRAQLKITSRGTVIHESHKELTQMTNILVILDQVAFDFPTETMSYSHIFWSTAETFLESAANKDVVMLNKSFSPLEYCVHGMCIMSSFNIVAHALGKDLYPFTYECIC